MQFVIICDCGNSDLSGTALANYLHCNKCKMMFKVEQVKFRDLPTELRLQKIEDHFHNISVEDFEAGLDKSGIGTINPSGMEMVAVQEKEVCWNCKDEEKEVGAEGMCYDCRMAWRS